MKKTLPLMLFAGLLIALPAHAQNWGANNQGYGGMNGMQQGFGGMNGMQQGFGGMNGMQQGFGGMNGMQQGFGGMNGMQQGFGNSNGLQGFGGMQAPSKPNLLGILFGNNSHSSQSQQQQQQPGMFSPQGLLRAFMGGSPTSGNNAAKAANDSQASGTAQSNLQTALDQAQQAEDACGRAMYGEKDMRNSAAESAQYHANAARAAAERAESAAYGHGQSAADYAAQARAAANRAQEQADRARYNASQGQ